jgi:hypothetical protein
VLYRAFVFLAATTAALSLLSLSACSSLTRPDDIVIVAEPASAPKAAAKPTAPSPPTAPVRGPAPGAAMGAPAPAAPAVPNGCGG